MYDLAGGLAGMLRHILNGGASTTRHDASLSRKMTVRTIPVRSHHSGVHPNAHTEGVWSRLAKNVALRPMMAILDSGLVPIPYQLSFSSPGVLRLGKDGKVARLSGPLGGPPGSRNDQDAR